MNREAAESSNAFGFDLYHKFKGEAGNLFFSPYSISTVLTMAFEGAKGKTAEEMQAVLHLPRDKHRIRYDFKKIYDELIKGDRPYKLTSVNALWAQEGYPFASEYINNIKKYYDGQATNLNFQTETENSRVTINIWVENKTNEKIRNLIPKGLLSTMTRLVLTNAIYFKADWSLKFNAENTREGRFRLASGEDITTKMMHRTDDYTYGETENLQILEMNYLGNDLSMLIILPKENNMSKMENIFDKENLNAWKGAMEYVKVRVTLPKFRCETKYFMAKDLKEMGMPTAFKYPGADFTTMSPSDELYIDEVIHQAFIEVAEYGTEAAAATAVVMMAGAAPPQDQPKQPKTFNADHPFIFIIQQKVSGSILFLGRMNDPR